ncbi:MAG TPA: hypothetical protein VL490_02780 [Mucilaginibacter sp.]|jgi:hypothetical protein|nr:hypothetical protein [Mucilaginibacter sp.]
MKNISKVILMMITAASFTACINHSDDHSARDTVSNRYGADTAKIEKMNKDTAAITDKTGDASSIDNSGSGGTKIAKYTAAKDTAQKKAEPEKK